MEVQRPFGGEALSSDAHSVGWRQFGHGHPPTSRCRCELVQTRGLPDTAFDGEASLSEFAQIGITAGADRFLSETPTYGLPCWTRRLLPMCENAKFVYR